MTPAQLIDRKLQELHTVHLDMLDMLEAAASQLYLPAAADARCAEARNHVRGALANVLRAMELTGGRR
ncbi:MAG: hypothetical protein SV862_00030 [Pseudomonadota bacterium]|nr:hypothetical protein [Pseudomonadota bacterium]